MACLPVKRFSLLFLLALPLAAAEQWSLPLFTSDPRAVLAAASRYPAPENLDAITLEYSVHVELDDSGKMRKTTRTITRVLRLQGIEGARQVSVRWAQWRENRPTIRARVITADGKPHLLDEAAISGDGNTLSADIRAVDIDSVVEVEIEQSDRDAAGPEGRWGEIMVSSRFPIAHFSALVGANPARELRVEPRGFHDVKQANSVLDHTRRVSVEASDIVPEQNGLLLPPDQAPIPAIAFSTASSWQSVAQWYAGLINQAVLGQASAPRTQPASPPDRLAAVETIFEEIHKKIHLAPTPLGEDPYPPQAPTETLRKATGDSKDEAVLLIGKLADIGIPAKPALLRPAPSSDVLPNVPGLEAFTQMLVYIPGANPLWIDPSAEFTPVSRLPLADQGRWALIIDPSTTNLVRTPETGAADNREITTTEIRLEDGSDAQVAITIEGHGAFEDISRPLLATTSQDETDKFRNELVHASQVRRIVKLDLGETKDLLAPSLLHIVAEGYAPSRMTDAGAIVDLPGPASINFEQLNAFLRAIAQGYPAAQIVGARKADFYVAPAFTEENLYHVIPPPGYRLTAPPAASPLALGPLSLTTTVKTDADGSLWVGYTLVDPKLRYTPQEMLAMLRDFQKLAGKGTLRIVFSNVAEEKIVGGQVKEGISLLRQNAEAAPSNPNPSLRLASAYVQVGAQADAHKIFEEITSKNPKNAAAYARLGWADTHDEFGRPFQPGMNLAEAEKAYEKAIELDPDDKSYVVRLANLYTYTQAGIHYGRSARLDDAIQKFREAGIAELPKYDALNEYAGTLLFAKRYDEVKQFFLYPQAENANPAIKLAAIAATGSATDVKEEADFIAPAPDKQKSLLLEAAQFLLLAREYQPAATLFQLVRGSPHGPADIELERIRRARNFEGSAASK
ncbi:MAG: DUF3857 domain-containing protein, partial [Bryobacteraceae bacterium]